MRTEQRISAMKKYFTAYPPKYPSISLILKFGIVLIAAGALILFFFKNTIVAGLLMIMGGVGLFSLWLRPYLREKKAFEERPPVDEMYQWLISDFHTHIKERASQVLKLNISQLKPENFMIVPYPVFWPEPGVPEETIVTRATEEGNVLYSTWKVQVIALTKNYISFYCCNYDWLSGAIANERTNEYFYDDISSVKNDVEQISVKLAGQEEIKMLNTFVFKVTNMSSDNLTVITKIPELNYSPKVEVSLEKAVQALRIILRKRRYDEDQDPIYIEPETSENDEDTEE